MTKERKYYIERGRDYKVVFEWEDEFFSGQEDVVTHITKAQARSIIKHYLKLERREGYFNPRSCYVVKRMLRSKEIDYCTNNPDKGWKIARVGLNFGC